MGLKQDVIEYTNHMVNACGLDSASIMVCTAFKGQGTLSYLYNTGLKSEFLYHYKKDGIFLSDPFLADFRSGDRFTFLPWQHSGKLSRSSVDYLNLINRFSVAPVGASIIPINPGLSLIIGTHRRGSKHQCRNIAISMLEDHVQRLSNMVLHDLLSNMTGHPQGLNILKRACIEGDFPNQLSELSAREAEIASMICLGMRNKEIGAQLGISEHTVENHLRNIYSKFQINNRASLVSRISNII